MCICNGISVSSGCRNASGKCAGHKSKMMLLTAVWYLSWLFLPLPTLASSEALSAQPVSENDSWKKYVLNRDGDFVFPETVRVEGNSAEVRNPKGILRADISEKFGDEQTATITTSSEGSSRLVIDLGTLGCGFVELGVVASSGAPIRMSYAEYLPMLGKWGDGDAREDSLYFKFGSSDGPDDNPDGRADVFSVPIISKPKPHTVLISPGIRGSQRYIAITLDGPGSATFDFVRIRKTNFQAQYDGHFLSSDETLNRAWYASAFSVDLSTAKDTRFNPKAGWIIMDGPKRDRTVWNNDLRIAGLSAFYQGIAYHDIIRDCLYLFAVQQLPEGVMTFSSRIDTPFEPYMDPGPADGVPDGYAMAWDEFLRIDSFSLWWVIQLDDYLRYSGDVAAVRPLLPCARRLMDFFSKHSEKGGVLWVSDAYDGKIPYNWHPADECIGIDVYGNEAYYAALLSMARLESVIANDEVEAQRLEKLAQKVKRELLDRFWDEKAGAMLQNSKCPVPDHAAESNVGALLFEMLDERMANRVIRHLNTKLGSKYGTLTSEFSDNPYMARYISPYLMANEAIGRCNYGDDRGALDLIRRAWGNMLEYGPTPWEEIGTDGKPLNPRAVGQGTGFLGMAHAWSTAVPALSMNVVGVRPLDDGFRKFVVRPHTADLAWAQGKVPVPGGVISVRWKRDNRNSRFVMTVEAPEHVEGDIAIPLFGGRRLIAIDGKIAWQEGQARNGYSASRNGDFLIFNNIRGCHTFAWTK